ncbi:MAG: chemotaxis protein CheB [Geminicoccaceae bacterium]
MTAPTWLVVVGASAGGLDPFSAFIDELEKPFDAAVIFCSHRGDNVSSRDQLTDLLARRTSLAVIDVAHGEPVRSSTIYVPRPGRHLGFSGGCFVEYDAPKDRYWRPSIDKVLENAVEAYGDRAIAVTLSGAMDDGVRGLEAVYKAGGWAFVQSPEEAAFESMPVNAIWRNHPEMIAPVRDIAKKITDIVATQKQEAAAAKK